VTKPLILLSNDDGYFSRGIRAMRAALSTVADVVTVAPETEQSAASHALTLHRPLRLRSVEPGVFAVDGTPADCVYVALHSAGRVLPRLPDVVVSGLNHGLNLGQDVFYSGTVAAAREAALRGVPALATSAHPKTDFEAACRMCADVALGLIGAGRTLVSVNVPADWLEKGRQVRATRLGTRIYEELLDFRKDPRGREYFWLGGPGVRHDSAPGTDTDAYDEGVASITALVLDLTDERPETSRLVDALARRAKNQPTE
jgi:5'-nucleotidase